MSNLETERSLDSLFAEWRGAVALTGPEVDSMRESILGASKPAPVLSVAWWQQVLAVPSPDAGPHGRPWAAAFGPWIPA